MKAVPIIAASLIVAVAIIVAALMIRPTPEPLPLCDVLFGDTEPGDATMAELYRDAEAQKAGECR